jgi:Domain of unknown function (DUF397)
VNGFVNWRKSSYSNPSGNCVQVGVWRKSSLSTGVGDSVEISGAEDGDFLMRDSKLGDQSPVLKFTPDEWDAFLQGVKGGEFDSSGG